MQTPNFWTNKIWGLFLSSSSGKHWFFALLTVGEHEGNPRVHQLVGGVYEIWRIQPFLALYAAFQCSTIFPRATHLGYTWVTPVFANITKTLRAECICTTISGSLSRMLALRRPIVSFLYPFQSLSACDQWPPNDPPSLHKAFITYGFF